MITGLLGILCGFLAGVCLLVSLLPLLGWLNWITSLPLAVIGLIFSWVSASRRVGSSLGTVGTVICLAVIGIALFRLLLGGGIL